MLLAIGTAGVLLALRLRLPGWWLRALALGVLVLALAGPQLREEERDALPNVAFLVVDRSSSTTLEDRTAQIEAAAEQLTTEIGALNTPSEPLELVTIDVTSESGAQDRGTLLLSKLDEVAARVDPTQIAGAILLSDGQVHDDERLKRFPAPVHALIAGEEDAFDLRLVLETAPAFGIVGEEVIFRLKAEALGAVGQRIGTRVPATVAIDGAPPRPVLLEVGQSTELTVEIEHGGPTVVDVQLSGHPDELTERNNRNPDYKNVLVYLLLI